MGKNSSTNLEKNLEFNKVNNCDQDSTNSIGNNYTNYRKANSDLDVQCSKMNSDLDKQCSLEKNKQKSESDNVRYVAIHGMDFQVYQVIFFKVFNFIKLFRHSFAYLKKLRNPCISLLMKWSLLPKLWCLQKLLVELLERVDKMLV